MHARLGGRLLLTLVAIGAIAASPLAALAGGSAPRPPSKVYVVQGVPGAAVDVTIDGSSVGKKLAAKGILGPLTLSQGHHSISFDAPGWSIDSSFNVSRPSMDVVLHWPADVTKQPDVTVFDNNIKAVSTQKGRLTVAHTAVVPPADVRVDNKLLFANIANGQFVTAEVPAANYSVEIVPTGEKGNPLLGPVKLPVKPGMLTRVFAIGQPENGSMATIVQRLPLSAKGSPAPASVDAGEAGLVATNHVGDAGTGHQLSAVVALSALAALGLLVVARPRRQPR